MTATSGTVSGTAPVTVTAGAATQLAFTTQPGNTLGAETFAPAVQVAVEDQYGNTVTTDNSSVTLALNQPAGTSFISGASWNNNVATITANNNLAANELVIIAGVTSSGPGSYNGTYIVTGATATTFTYALLTNPGSYTSGGTAGVGNGGGGSLNGTLTEQADNGVAAFPGLSISQVVSGTTYGAAGAGYTLTASTASDGGLRLCPPPPSTRPFSSPA